MKSDVHAERGYGRRPSRGGPESASVLRLVLRTQPRSGSGQAFLLWSHCCLCRARPCAVDGRDLSPAEKPEVRYRGRKRSEAEVSRGRCQEQTTSSQRSDELVDEILEEFLASARVRRRFPLLEHVGFEFLEPDLALFDLLAD